MNALRTLFLATCVAVGVSFFQTESASAQVTYSPWLPTVASPYEPYMYYHPVYQPVRTSVYYAPRYAPGYVYAPVYPAVYTYPVYPQVYYYRPYRNTIRVGWWR